MSLTGSTTSAKIWNYLYSKIGNAYGVAGLMGNLYAESGLSSNNLQNSYEKSLGYTDETYTAAVDNGTYTNFASDSAGYGLAQWTYSARKKNMLAYHQSQNASIGDLETQLEFLVKELKESYTSVWNVLKSASSVKEASTKVLTGYEKPANQGTSVQNTRANYGQQYYDKYAGTTTTTTTTATTTTSSSSSGSSGYTAGTKVTLKNAALYASATSSTKAATKSGTYYLWDSTVTNSRIRITNSKGNVGKSGKVTGWVNTSAISSSTSSSSSSSITAGMKLTLKKCPLYVSSTAATKANTVTGTYYLYSTAKTNGRYMITNKKSNVGKSGQVTGWIDKSYVE